MALASALPPSPGAPMTPASATSAGAVPDGAGASPAMSLAICGAASSAIDCATSSLPAGHVARATSRAAWPLPRTAPPASRKVQRTVTRATPAAPVSSSAAVSRRKLPRLPAAVLAGTSAARSACASASASAASNGALSPDAGCTSTPTLSGGCSAPGGGSARASSNGCGSGWHAARSSGRTISAQRIQGTRAMTERRWPNWRSPLRQARR